MSKQVLLGIGKGGREGWVVGRGEGGREGEREPGREEGAGEWMTVIFIVCFPSSTEKRALLCW